jgi:uncharacterized protein
MIAGMTPVLQPGAYVYLSTTDPALIGQLALTALSTFREAEGLSLLIPLEAAQAHALNTAQPMHCITLNVYSALDGVGLTAAVAGALAAEGIACNMIAACHHDHVLVPIAESGRAMAVLLALQQAGAHR